MYLDCVTLVKILDHVQFIEHIHTSTMSFGKKIKELRENQMLSQQDLADRINRLCGTQLKRNTISNYERDKSFPDQDKLIAIVRILETTSDVLLGLQHDSPDNRRSANSDQYRVEDSLENHEQSSDFSNNRIPLNFREYRYISANQHTMYAKKCNEVAYLNLLPTVRIPSCTNNLMRAFQLSKSHQCTLKKWDFGNGDVLLGERTDSKELDLTTPFYIVVWKNIGLKIFRHHELIQLMDLPEVLEIWVPKVLIRYNLDSSQICHDIEESPFHEQQPIIKIS